MNGEPFSPLEMKFLELNCQGLNFLTPVARASSEYSGFPKKGGYTGEPVKGSQAAGKAA